MIRRSLIINSKDNVAILLEKSNKDDTIKVGEKEILLQQDVEFGHKVAIVDLNEEDIVYKYGEEIGYMITSVSKGTLIHNHNMGCRRGK